MNSSLVTTSRQIVPQFGIENLVVNPYETLAIITSGCVIAGIEELLVQTLLLEEILKINLVAGVVIRRESQFPQIVTADHEVLDHAVAKLDVKNYDDVRLVENAGKGKKGGKKGGEDKASKKGKNIEQEEAAQRKKDEEERLRKWNEDWDKKLKAQEDLDGIPCCSADGLALKPKTQSNLWIKVTQDKTIQDVQMAFMHVPVPRPKAPPLPKLVKTEPVDPVPLPEKKKKNVAKKKGKGKKK